MMNFLRKQMKWVMAIIVVAFLLSTFLMYEGRGTRRTPSRNADGTMSDYEVAQINGQSLMRSELERRLRNYLSNYSSRSANSLDMPSLYKTVLDQAVLDSQLQKEIQERGISVSDSDAEYAMKVYADTYYPTRETFYQSLAQSGIKVEDYKKSLAHQMAIERLFGEVVGQIEVSEDKAVEFYDTMKNLIYSKPEGFMIHMADFNTSADAENFRTRLVNGESWDLIVSKNDIPSKDVINITKDPVFLPSSALKTGTLTVLASLDILQPSPVFSVSSFDFAVGLKASHVDASLTPYNEVSADIKAMLTQQEQRKRLNDYEASLREKAQLVINDEALFTKTQEPEKAPEVASEDVKVESVEPVEQEAVNVEEAETKSEDTAPVEEVKSEDVEVESVEPVEQEAVKVEEAETKSEDTAPVEEAKSEDVEVESVEPVEQEVVNVEEAETKSEDTAPVEEAKSEDVEVESVEPVEQEAVKVEEAETKSEDTTPVEEVKEGTKVESIDEAVNETVEEIKETINEIAETISEEIKSEDK